MVLNLTSNEKGDSNACISNLPNELRLLEWHKHPLIKLSQNFENCSGFVPNLEELDLQNLPVLPQSIKLILLDPESCASLTNLQDKHTESLINLGPEQVLFKYNQLVIMVNFLLFIGIEIVNSFLFYV